MPSCSEQIISLYERHAHAFDADRLRVLFEKPWLDRFTALLPPSGSILDLGCGSSEPLAKYFVDQRFSVFGIDASPTLIALCKQRLPTHAWQVADMRGLSLGRTFDGIIAWDSLFHLSHDDQRRMFAVFGCHTTPTGVLMFTAGPSLGEAIGSYREEPLYHASLDSSEYRLLLQAHGFRVIRHVIEDPECHRHTVWLAQREP